MILRLNYTEQSILIVSVIKLQGIEYLYQCFMKSYYFIYKTKKLINLYSIIKSSITNYHEYKYSTSAHVLLKSILKMFIIVPLLHLTISVLFTLCRENNIKEFRSVNPRPLNTVILTKKCTFRLPNVCFNFLNLSACLGYFIYY